MNDFWYSFIPLFVAVDAIGVLPLFISFTEGLNKQKIRKVIIQSVITAAVVAALFIWTGQMVLGLLGITVADFMIAGGTLLFAISLSDMLSMEKRHRTVDCDSLGAVPIGVPLIVGPAVLTTALLLIAQHGTINTMLAAFANILIAGAVFFAAPMIYKFLGKGGSKTISKLAALILAAIGVMMVRKGIMIFLVK